MTNPTLIERLEARADHDARRAEIMARFADTLPVRDAYRAQADADADRQHSLAADLRDAIAILRASGKAGEG